MFDAVYSDTNRRLNSVVSTRCTPIPTGSHLRDPSRSPKVAICGVSVGTVQLLWWSGWRVLTAHFLISAMPYCVAA